MPTPIPPTPSAAEISQLARDTTQILTIWNSLGPVMAIILVCAFALAVVFFSQRDNSKGNSAVLKMLADNNLQKDKDIADLKEQRDQEHQQHRADLAAVKEQFTRTNDLFEVTNKRGTERDAQQGELVKSQAQIAADLRVITTSGSAPVQEILGRVRLMADSITRIDSRTANWDVIALAITPLIIELGALKLEVKKHSTQPLPPVESLPTETSPL